MESLNIWVIVILIVVGVICEPVLALLLILALICSCCN
jgi:hypothetical protein